MKGYLFLNKPQNFFLHVCSQGQYLMKNYSYGGGGPGQYSGGGSSDVRLILFIYSDVLNNFKLLKHDEPNVVSVFVMNMIDVIDIQFSNALSRICKLDEEEKDIDGIFLQFLNAVFEI